MELFGFPKEWKIDKNIPKEIIYKVADADDKIKKIFIDSVEKIRLLYSITPNNINVEKYLVGEEKYKEINFIRIYLKKKGKENTILKSMHKIIPKGTVIVLEFHDKILISLANKKISENRVKVEELYNSEWIDDVAENIKIFQYKNYKSGNLKIFYESIVDTIRMQNLKIKVKIENKDLEKLEKLNKEIEELKIFRKKEIQINKIAELQSKLIKKIEERKEFLK